MVGIRGYNDKKYEYLKGFYRLYCRISRGKDLNQCINELSNLWRAYRLNVTPYISSHNYSNIPRYLIDMSIKKVDL